jgi:hypothetical protein
MVPFIYTPRDHHGARTPEEYRAKQAAAIAKLQTHGFRCEVHVEPTGVSARIDANTWLIDCECGAGNATDPAWGFACCFGCGAIHTTVLFPDDATLIEAALIARPNIRSRGWDCAGYRGRLAGQTVEDLVTENETIGLDVVPEVISAELKLRAASGVQE